jgi:hypothetical protein
VVSSSSPRLQTGCCLFHASPPLSRFGGDTKLHVRIAPHCVQLMTDLSDRHVTKQSVPRLMLFNGDNRDVRPPSDVTLPAQRAGESVMLRESLLHGSSFRRSVAVTHRYHRRDRTSQRMSHDC